MSVHQTFEKAYSKALARLCLGEGHSSRMPTWPYPAKNQVGRPMAEAKRERIISVMSSSTWMKTKLIAQRAEIPHVSTFNYLKELTDEGLVIHNGAVKGQLALWRLP